MSHDTLLHRLVRPPARALASTRLRPNHVTALRIASGLGAAGCFAAATPVDLRLGATLFVLSALLDRADGELARQSGRFSQLGHWLDLASDCSCDALVFLGLALGAWGGRLGNLAPLLGMLAGVGTVLLFWQLNLPDERTAPRPAPRGRPARRAFDPDDLILGVPLIVCTAGPDVALLLAGILTPLALLGVVIARRRPQRAAGPGRARPRSSATLPFPPLRPTAAAINHGGARDRTVPHG